MLTHNWVKICKLISRMNYRTKFFELSDDKTSLQYHYLVNDCKFSWELFFFRSFPYCSYSVICTGQSSIHFPLAILYKLNAVKCNLMEITTNKVCVLWGAAELLCTHASAFTYFSVPSCQALFCETLAPVHLSGVCVPFCFTVFIHAPVPVHALSLHWQACAVSGLLLSTRTWISAAFVVV